MGKSKKKLAPKGKQEAKTEKLSKHIQRNRMPMRGNRGNRGNFRSFNDFPGRSGGYASYGNYDYGPYAWYKGNHSNTRPYYRTKPPRRPPSRPASPALGSAEYMERKIQQTSAIIMEQLLNPDKQIVGNNIQTLETTKETSSKSTHEQHKKTGEKPVETVSNKNKSKKISKYNIEEIQKKIMNHITNLNDGRKKNLINSHISGYDPAIQQIQKQKRLEVSRALRDMCSKSNETQESRESSNFINSIIPDMGIKIEDIPRDLLEELRNTLNLDLEYGTSENGYCPMGEWQNENTNTSDCFIIETPCSAVGITPEPNQQPLAEDVEHSSKINESGAQTNHDTNVTDSIENQQLEQVLKSENVPNICSSSLTEPAGQVPKPEPIDDRQLVLNDASNFSVDEPVNQVPSVKLEPTEEARLVLDDTLNSSVKLEPTEEPRLVLDDTLNCNKIKEDQNLDTNSIENIATVSDTIKQEKLESGTSHNKSDDCIIVDDEEKICILIADADCDKGARSEINLHNTERNQTKDSQLNNAVPGNNESTLKPTTERTNVGTQTKDVETVEESIELLLTKHFTRPPRSISEAIGRMLEVDQCISKLTTYRQSLFSDFKEVAQTDNEKVGNKTTKSTKSIPTNVSSQKRKSVQLVTKARFKAKKKRSRDDSDRQQTDRKSTNVIQKETERLEPLGGEYVANSLQAGQHINANNSAIIDDNKRKVDHNKPTSGVQGENEQREPLNSVGVLIVPRQQGFLTFQEVNEKMLVLKVVEDELLVAATESGKIFLCSLEDGHYIKVIEASRVPITCLLFIKRDEDYIQMFVGSHEYSLLQFTIHKFQNSCPEKKLSIGDSIQCMENKWEYIFIGGMRGSILRYSLRKNKVEYADKYTNDSILVMRASQEGARKILIIGSRNSPICIRDAMTGLQIRTMATDKFTSFPTVYSLILEKNLVYSGTSNHDILVYCFHDGRLVHRLKATDSKGVSCMKVIRNLLFASCHNGSIYVYNLRDDNKFLGSIAGPGGVILSMEVLTNQVIIGTMTSKLTSIPIPRDILEYLYN